MKVKRLSFLFIFFCLLFPKSRWDEWLEEVYYLITPLEKKIFLSLKTDKQREEFVKKFWLIRDPVPETPVNEFKEEYYRRWHYVNKYFSSPGKRDGWKTDMGRIYLLLGKPIEVQRYEGYEEIYPCQLWLYHGDKKLGLPAYFYILFYKPHGVGRYKLYDPARDGPEKLLTPVYIQTRRISRLDAYRILYEISPELAKASTSFLMGEGGDIRSFSFGGSTGWLMSRIFSIPRKIYENAIRSRKLKGYVDVAELIFSKESHGIYFVTPFSRGYLLHLAIQPEDIYFEFKGGIYISKLELMITVNDVEGNTVYKKDRTITLRVLKENYARIRKNPIILEEVIPVIPGFFKISVILNNKADNSYYSEEYWVNLLAPPGFQSLPVFRLKQNFSFNIKPFSLRGIELYPNPAATFTFNEKVQILFWFDKGDSKIEVKLKRFDKHVETFYFEKKRIFLLNLPAKNLGVGTYVLEAYEIMKESKRFLGETVFYISPEEKLREPSFLLKVYSGDLERQLYWDLGRQFLATGKPKDALFYFEQFLPENPKIDHFLDLAKSYLMMGLAEKAVQELQPFSHLKKHEISLILAKAYMELKDYRKALKLLADLEVKGYEEFRLIGECYYYLGDRKKAVEFWQKSLQINPDQEDLKEKLKGFSRGKD